MTTDAPPTTLAAFLLERYDEIEAAVKEHSEPWPLAGAYSWIRNEINDYDLHADPAYVLADLEAKRRIVEMHEHAVEYEGFPFAIDYCRFCVHSDNDGNDNPMEGDWPCEHLKLLALPYRDHRDFREEWRA